MSISYNITGQSVPRLTGMNSFCFSRKLSAATIVGLIGLVFDVVANGAEEAAGAGTRDASPLAPLAFFTAHEWEAKLPDSKDGKKMSIHARFTWAENHQAILISNHFVIDGKPMPYITGLYVWNPEKKSLVFTYVDGKGSLSEGTVRMEGNQLIHEFHEINPSGKSEQFVARVTPHGTESWDNAIFAGRGDGQTPIVQVQYLPAR